MDNLLFLKPISIKGKFRIGSYIDGGYVVYKKLLYQTEILISYGIAWDVSFEEHFNKLTNKRVLMFDPTTFGRYLIDFKYLSGLVKNLSIAQTFKYLFQIYLCWAKLKTLRQRNIQFINEGLSTKPKDKYNTLKYHIDHFSVTEREILLKIDIEENEYEILKSDAFYECLTNINQIIIEFHNLKNRLRDLQAIINRLTPKYYLIHIHGNNYGGSFTIYRRDLPDLSFPDSIEVTFIKKTNLDPQDIDDKDILYPVSEIDFPNNPDLPDYQLDFGC